MITIIVNNTGVKYSQDVFKIHDFIICSFSSCNEITNERKHFTCLYLTEGLQCPIDFSTKVRLCIGAAVNNNYGRGRGG